MSSGAASTSNSTATFEEPFTEIVNARWQSRLDVRRLFVNEQVLSLVRRPARGKTGLVDRWQRRGRGSTLGDTADLRELDAACTALAAALEPYGARVLGIYDRHGARHSEPLEFLSALYNGELRPALLPDDVDLGQHIPYRRVSFGQDTIEVRGRTGRATSSGCSRSRIIRARPARA